MCKFEKKTPKILRIVAMADKRQKSVPVKLRDFSVLDTEFDSIRERFDSEMASMEAEMNKFRSELLDRESSFFSRQPHSFGGAGTRLIYILLVECFKENKTSM